MNILQAFGAANDNIFKQFVIMSVVSAGIWNHHFGEGGTVYVSLIFSLPFIFLAGFAGQFSDKYSKRKVVLVVKIWEVMLALFCVVALYFGSFPLALFCVVLLGIQSTLFSPTKLGIIPELVENHQITNANGILGMVSNISIVLGSAVGGFFSDHYKATCVGRDLIDAQMSAANLEKLLASVSEPHSTVTWMLVPGVCMLILAMVGLWCAMRLPKLSPKSPDMKIRFGFYGFFGINFDMMRQAAGTPLLAVTGAFAVFFIIPGVALLNMAEYGEYLKVSDFLASAQGAFLAVSIGIGGVVVGQLSKHRVRPRFILIGAVGMTVGFTMLAFIPRSYVLTVAVLSLSGFFAGFYMIPLQALLQVLTTEENRGRFIGMNTVTTMIGFVFGNYLLRLGLVTFGWEPPKIYLICAAVGAIMFFPLWLRWIPWFERAVVAKQAGVDVSDMPFREAGN
ncbi:MAG: MFS transporter [Planctomycetota bacterium]|nr:MFS transporter [Planctomycetota bacterium]